MSLFDKLMGLFGRTPRNGASAESGEMISCHDALVLVHEYLDGELTDVSEAQVKAHFEVCQACYPHLHLETAFREALRRAATGEAAPHDLKARIVDALAEADSEG